MLGPAGPPLHRPVQCAPHSGSARSAWPRRDGGPPVSGANRRARGRRPRPPAGPDSEMRLAGASSPAVAARCGRLSRLLGWDGGQQGKGYTVGSELLALFSQTRRVPSPPHLSRGAPHSPWCQPRKRTSSQRAHRASGAGRASRAGRLFGQKRDRLPERGGRRKGKLLTANTFGALLSWKGGPDAKDLLPAVVGRDGSLRLVTKEPIP